MSHNNEVLTIGLLAGAAGYLGMAVYVWRRRDSPSSTTLLISVLATAVWALGYGVEMTTSSVGTAMFWNTIKYTGVLVVPAALLAFAIDYTAGGRAIGRRTMAMLAIEPVLVMVLLLTPLRSLFQKYDPATMTLYTSWPTPEPQPLFYVHVFYSYALLVIALALLGWRMAKLAVTYWRPAALVIGASLLALVGNAYYNLRYPALTVDPAPFLFTLLLGTLVWGLFNLGLIDLAPVARGAVIEQMGDAVLILDAQNRVLDINPAATALLGGVRSQLIGRKAGQLLPPLADRLDAHRPNSVQKAEINSEGGWLPGPPPGPAEPSGPRYLSSTLSSLVDRAGREAGRVLVLRDVTERTETEQRLREMLEAETRLASVLQTGLRPAKLPDVPRVRLAARALAAGEGTQVSGDFYDVHQVLGGDWALVLGDVAGKGVHAAVVTSMARYTVRALSAQGWSPRQVAEQLNQALLAETGPERFCTMVYARISERPTGSGKRSPAAAAADWAADAEAAEGERPDGAPGREPHEAPSGVRLTLGLSGHPQPLLRHRDGSIERVGKPGTALGLISLPEVTETVIDLEPGDVLLAYTDGVTEARRERVEFGEERLTELLAGTATGLRGRTGPAAATLVAESVADRVMEEVTSYAPSRDDIAVLVLVAV